MCVCVCGSELKLMNKECNVSSVQGLMVKNIYIFCYILSHYITLWLRSCSKLSASNSREVTPC